MNYQIINHLHLVTHNEVSAAELPCAISSLLRYAGNRQFSIAPARTVDVDRDEVLAQPTLGGNFELDYRAGYGKSGLSSRVSSVNEVAAFAIEHLVEGE